MRWKASGQVLYQKLWVCFQLHKGREEKGKGKEECKVLHEIHMMISYGYYYFFYQLISR